MIAVPWSEFEAMRSELAARLAAAEKFIAAIRALNPVNLCWMIERLPASTQQTEISVAASAIAHAIQQALSAYRAAAPEAGGDCPRARSDMTPCVLRDGDMALSDSGVCVGCGWKPAPDAPKEGGE